MGLLASIQERVGTLSKDRASVMAGLQAGALLEELEQEMQNLRGISEEIAMLQWRLRRSLHERESNISTFAYGRVMVHNTPAACAKSLGGWRSMNYLNL